MSLESIQFHPRDPIFICGGGDEHIHLYDYLHNKRIMKSDANLFWITATAFHQTLPLFLVVGTEDSIVLYDYKRKENLGYFACLMHL